MATEQKDHGQNEARPSTLDLIKRLWKGKEAEPPAQPEKKYVHVPTHAASSHLKTTSSKSIQKANEIL
ncbi:hypothetical protein QBC47DRAFT_404846 [Echria macrotheca]|uniref:Uncharacterized protein n=1 Tax=Echria macrotheca TaxID=438768 RepID=A0AAJ0B6E3_9PEZI|nr:hypothetical protein QBC47DRAFT_404846 [Echria macrotheca]